jgi:hypothetical protein
MSAGKIRPLSVRVAYLRLCENGLGLNVKWARKLTPFILRMVREGELVLRNVNHSARVGGKSVTTAYVTDAGRARLEAALARHGADFGPIGEADRDQPHDIPKTVRRKRLRDCAVPDRIERQRKRAIRERVLKLKAESTPASTRKRRRAAARAADGRKTA